MKTVLIDFDGVLNSYVSGWQGRTVLHDPPNEGAIEWLQELIDDPDFEPVIFTTRVHCKPGEDPDDAKAGEGAIRAWLYLSGLGHEDANRIKITDVKQPAVMQVDDRAFPFMGYFPTLDLIRDFKPWCHENRYEGVPMAGVEEPVPGGDYPTADLEDNG